MMGGRSSRESSRGSITLQKKLVESRRPSKTENVRDLTDFMNDMFFGTVNNDDKKGYNLTGNRLDDEEESFDDSTRSNSSRLTQEWLEEARRMMASSPKRCESPSRFVGSPRFGCNDSGPVAGRFSISSTTLDRKDPLSRSSRRQRGVEGIGEEILIKSAKHSRSKSVSIDNLEGISPAEPSPASQVQQWFVNKLKPTSTHNQSSDSPDLCTDPTALNLPPRQSTFRKSRFQAEPPAPTSLEIPVTPRRSFKPAPSLDKQLLSPPKHLIESARRRSISSSSSCAQPDDQPLSPPRNLVESTQRRFIAKSTCSINEKIAPKSNAVNDWQKKQESTERDITLNGFLKKQRIKIEKILNGEIDYKAKVILSGSSNSTSSMIGAICYAWLLENRMKKNKEEGCVVVVPVINVRRGRMWKQRQAAWLFHHVGLDATSLFFADEVDLESLIMAGKLSILVVGQDILTNDTEYGSQCTVLTDNYCEDAYDLLQTAVIKTLLLAGILLDTQNLKASAKLSKTRDAEAVQLLLVGSAPSYRSTLFDELMQDRRDDPFFEALRYNYGKPPNESGLNSTGQLEKEASERKSTSVSQNQALIQNSDIKNKDVKNAKDTLKPKKAPPARKADAPRGKNTFFLAKWFGFGK